MAGAGQRARYQAAVRKFSISIARQDVQEYVSWQRLESDRRSYVLTLTSKGSAARNRLMASAFEHERGRPRCRCQSRAIHPRSEDPRYSTPPLLQAAQWHEQPCRHFHGRFATDEFSG
jgi:hypothetical protein